MSSIVSSPRHFTKKPVKIEAMMYTGVNRAEIMRWATDSEITEDDRLAINTLEGQHTVSVGDYVIKGIQGEFYPCKPDIFKASYDPVYPQPEDEEC